MNADLHIHTQHSAGSYTVPEVLLAARERKLDCISITDHFTTAGSCEAERLGHRFGVTVVPGVEIAARDTESGRPVSILGYQYDPPAASIERLCRPLRNARNQTTIWQIEQLREAGYQISVDEVRDAAVNAAVLFPVHIKTTLIAKGYADSFDADLFDELFSGSGICARTISLPTVTETIGAVKADNGLAVLARPGLAAPPNPSLLDTPETLARLISYGLDGLELYSPYHNTHDHSVIARAADAHHLVLTGGSNDHGTFGAYPTIGDLRAPFSSVRSVLPRQDEEIEWTIGLVEEAGRIARKAACGEIEPEQKNNDIRDLVTHHDVAVERHLTNAIRERFPYHAFVTEEADHAPPDPETPTWIIDPIDGTTNFVSSGDCFAVSVAHFHGEQPQFGIVYDVMAGDLYVGIRGKGAFLNGRRIEGWDHPKPIEECVVEASLLTNQRLHEWYGADPKLLATGIRAQRAHGSAAIGICRIARSTIDAYLSSSLSLWDYAAAIIVLAEAGGAAGIAKHPPGPTEPTGGANRPQLESWFHDDKRLFLAAGSEKTLNTLISRLFPASKVPQITRLSAAPDSVSVD